MFAKLELGCKCDPHADTQKWVNNCSIEKRPSKLSISLTDREVMRSEKPLSYSVNWNLMGWEQKAETTGEKHTFKQSKKYE